MPFYVVYLLGVIKTDLNLVPRAREFHFCRLQYAAFSTPYARFVV